MAEGHVLVISAGAGRPWLTLLVTRLAEEHLPIVLGPDLGGFPSYAEQAEASALVVALGPGDWPSEAPSPVREFIQTGQAVLVNSDPRGRRPASANGLVYIDLSEWPTGGAQEFARLAADLRALIESGLQRRTGEQLENWHVNVAESGISKLANLLTKVAAVGDVLADDAEHSLALRTTLAEISGTYRVVKSALECFVAAGLEPGGPSGPAYARLAHGLLEHAIHNGRGHCTRIGSRYERVGGLRDALKGRHTPEVLAELDKMFEELANADGDVFSAMDMLGNALTNDSRVVVRYLVTGRVAQAREHIAQTVDRLLPLETVLDDALESFQTIELALGYAESLPSQEGVNVTNQSITIYGDVVQSNVVAANTIENSSIMVSQTSLPQDLQIALLELHKATAALTRELPNDEAALAARDLEDLAKEATSSSPRSAFWRRAAEGLVEAARKVADVGVPVIELVTKVTALLG